MSVTNTSKDTLTGSQSGIDSSKDIFLLENPYPIAESEKENENEIETTTFENKPTADTDDADNDDLLGLFLDEPSSNKPAPEENKQDNNSGDPLVLGPNPNHAPMMILASPELSNTTTFT